jgi:delta 1-pyrroline-5-carboxylate dehydrogenase
MEPGLAGAMLELRLGDPADIRTDVGPVIEEKARATLVRSQASLASERQDKGSGWSRSDSRLKAPAVLPRKRVAFPNISCD